MAWVPLGVLALLTTAVAAIAVLSQQWAAAEASPAASNQGFYWAVSQYQLADLRLKQELRAIAAGERADMTVLSDRAAVLASKGSILSEPSEIVTRLNELSGYAHIRPKLTELHHQINPILQRPQFAQRDAATVLTVFQASGIDEPLSQLANDLRQAELVARESAFQRLSQRLAWSWAGFGLCWISLALWLLHAVRQQRRYRIAARERQDAVTSLRYAIEAKRKFLNMVSHELRSPLQSLVTATESLGLDPAISGGRPQSSAALRRIRHAVSAMQAQLRDLLTIARSQASEMGTQVETFDFGQLVRDVCADFDDMAHAKGLSLTVEVPPRPITVRADPVRAAQVLRNLVENAVRYTSTGAITVRLKPLEMDPQAATLKPSALSAQKPPHAIEAWIHFEVSDTGPGLSPQGVARLNSATEAFESDHDGHGIGLFVIRDVLRQLGGHLEVDGRPGKGTQVAVHLPVQVPMEPAAPGGGVDALSSAAPVEALSVLIVDDNDDVLKALGEATRRLGHACDIANSATQAAPLLARSRYDAALIDLDMPGQDGRDLAQGIRQGAGPNRDAMLILISAAQNRAVGSAPPFDGFLEKPIDAQALARLIGSRTRH